LNAFSFIQSPKQEVVKIQMNVFKILGEKLSLEGDRAIRFFGGFKTQMLR